MSTQKVPAGLPPGATIVRSEYAGGGTLVMPEGGTKPDKTSAEFEAERLADRIKEPAVIKEYFHGNAEALQRAKLFTFPEPIQKGHEDHTGGIRRYHHAVFLRSKIEEWRDGLLAIAAIVGSGR
jgi:hypothetical protein